LNDAFIAAKGLAKHEHIHETTTSTAVFIVVENEYPAYNQRAIGFGLSRLPDHGSTGELVLFWSLVWTNPLTE
jgi:hypothetical protein